MRKKLAGWLMAAILLCTAGIPASASEGVILHQEEEAVQVQKEEEAILLSGYGVAPAYRNIYTSEDIHKLLEKENSQEESSRASYQGGQLVANSHAEAVTQLREMLRNRATSFSLALTYVNQFSQSIFTQLLEDALAEGSGTPAAEGDYIKANFLGYHYNVSYGAGLGSLNYGLTFTYAADAQQEAQVTQRVAEVIAVLGLAQMDDYHKIKTIHDYIVNNTAYKDDGTNQCHSAYSALIQGYAVCQGYAGLFQRLCKEVGIETRYITGYAGEAHAWNIVKLDNQWYNVDVTWDDPIGGSLRYDYFLKAEIDFSDHIRDQQYDTDAFHAAYPMADFSYGKASAEGVNQENYSYTFKGTDGSQISSASTGKPLFLIFFGANCGNCQTVLQELAKTSWVLDGTVDVIAIETQKHTQAEVINFQNVYCPQGKIRFGYDTGVMALNALWDYARLVGAGSSITYPFMVMIDGDNKVQYDSVGYTTAAKIERLYLPLLSTRNTFSDVPYNPGGWKYDAVQYMYENGIMNGIAGTDRFDPDGQLTRAMFATVLYRMAGRPGMAYSPVFADVPAGQYYTEAVLWANSQQIATGIGNGSFGVMQNITREQIAKMLYEFGSKKGYAVSGRASLDNFTDTASMSSWAGEYMQWAVSAGMISGKPNGDGSFRLDPKGQATRAECAKMLMMFQKQYGN